MPTPNNVPITPGSGDNISTFQVSRDATTEQIQAIAVVDAGTANPALVDTTGSLQTLMYDLDASIRELLTQSSNPLWLEASTGRLRITLDAMAGALTLATITTVSTVTTVGTVNTVTAVTTLTNQNQMGAQDIKQTLLFSNELMAWGTNVRNCITS